MGSRDVAAEPPTRRLDREWLPLAALLGVLLLALLVTGRSGWSGWFGDEAEHYLAAESLARDLDLAWDERDRDRQAVRRAAATAESESATAAPAGMPFPLPAGAPPPELTRSPVYALYLAPFVGLAPARGPAVANWLLLALASWLVARRLRRRLGASAPLLVALLVFGSVSFAYVALALPATLLLAATAIGFALAYAHEEPAAAELTDMYRPPDRAAGHRLRWLGIGALLALPVAEHPLYLLLLLPVLVAVPRERRGSGAALLLAGAALGLLGIAGLARLGGVEGWVLAGWSDAARAWELAAADPGLVTQDAAEGLAGVLAERLTAAAIDWKRTLWNGVYFLAGANVGVLPFFLPVLLLTAAWSSRTGRSMLFVTAAVIAALFVLLLPFDFWGGPGAIANRRFLPLFGALWLVPVRPLKRSELALTGLLAALFVWPLWLAPAGPPVEAGRGYRHNAGLASRYLPHETTQRDVLTPGEQMRSGLWVRSLGGARPAGDRWRLAGGETAAMLLAAAVELESVFLQFAAGTPAELEVRRGRLGDTILRPDGRVGFDIREPRHRASHRMWWSREAQELYIVEFRLPETRGSFTFTISGVTRVVAGEPE